MQLKWTDLAGTDLEKIEVHIAKENSPSVAIDVVMKIIDSSHSILSEQLLIRTSQSGPSWPIEEYAGTCD
ncbi:RelE/StbE family addiction module toxin (modular protein) [Alteromonas alvinellae]